MRIVWPRACNRAASDGGYSFVFSRVYKRGRGLIVFWRVGYTVLPFNGAVGFCILWRAALALFVCKAAKSAILYVELTKPAV